MTYKSNPEIDVLLATYNGEKFLLEFLESLVKQSEVRINLIVGDDGSTDKTLSIIESFIGRFSSLVIYRNTRLGPLSNFRFLLSKSQALFIAFADQDDVWNSNHLRDSVIRVQQFNSNNPTLSVCSTLSFGVKIKDSAIFPKCFLPDFRKNLYFFENAFRGCTMVINDKLREVLLKSNWHDAVMHDWWIFLTALYSGKVNYVLEPEVNYRIHSANVIGEPTLNDKVKKVWKIAVDKDWAPLRQAIGFLDDPIQSMSEIERLNLSNLTAALIGRSNIISAFRVVLNSRFRASTLQNMALKLLLLIRVTKFRLIRDT